MQLGAEEFPRRLKAVADSPDVVSIRRNTMHALDLFGISTAYYVAPITGDARVSRIVTNIGLPWIWERQYRARLHLIDPLPRIAIDRLEAFIWPDELGDEKLSPKERRYISIAAKYGLARGVAVACFGPNGRSGFLGAVLSKDAPTPDGIALMRIHSLGQTSIQRYCKLVPRTLTIPALSNRELEVLHWIGQGKSNSVIAELLEISPSSVDVYVRRLFAKLDVSDRTMAAVKALSLGMIISGDYTKMLADAAKLQDPGDSLPG